MDKNARFGLAVALISLGAGAGLILLFARHPAWYSLLLYAGLFVCAITLIAALIMVFLNPAGDPRSRPDKPIQAGFYYYRNLIWPNETPDDFKADEEMNLALKQAAFDERIDVWGRKDGEGAIQKIPPTFWGPCGIDPAARSPEPGNRAQTQKALGDDGAPYGFQDLRISKAQFEHQWPRYKR